MRPFEVIRASAKSLRTIGKLEYDTIVLITQSGVQATAVAQTTAEAMDMLRQHIAEPEVLHIAFISKEDGFDINELTACIETFYAQTPQRGFALLLPYKPPPTQEPSAGVDPRYGQREDGFARSFIIATKQLRVPVASAYLHQLGRLTYECMYAYLNSSESNNISVVQIGKPFHDTSKDVSDMLHRSLMVIPHKDSLALLKRCLNHLNKAPHLPATINLCFDDDGHTKFDAAYFTNANARLKIFANYPGNVGPYLPRHYSILSAGQDFIFFQDSDDIPVAERFTLQLRELKERGLDMLGSHELRLDEFEKSVMIIRYPLDVSRSLSALAFHPLYHPTALITRKAYLKTGGFSTNLRFGYDSQFLLRSHFYLKIGNIDDFLYIRYKRPNSLTTDPKTRLGSNLRKFLEWRWKTDLRLVTEQKLDLLDSSLSVQRHRFNYRMKKVVV